MTMTVRESLYDLSAIGEWLDRLLDENGGELPPDVEPIFDAFHEKFSEKVENTALLVRQLKSEAEGIKVEADRLASRIAAKLHKAAALEALLLTVMQRTKTEKVNGVLATVAVRLNNPKVEPVVDLDDHALRNLAMSAPDFVRHEESWALDKKAVLESHKANTLPDDLAKMVKVTRTQRIEIK